MKFYRKYSDEEVEEEITIEEAVRKLEGNYYKKGTVKEMLENGNRLRSIAAEYYSR